MRLLILTAFVLWTPLITADEKKPEPREKEVRDFEDEWEKALDAGDVAKIEQMVGKEFLVMTVAGGTMSRQDYLKTIPGLKGTRKHVQSKFNRLEIFGDTAIVCGESRVLQRKGVACDFTLAWTDILVKREGRWQCVALQFTLKNDQWDAGIRKEEKK